MSYVATALAVVAAATAAYGQYQQGQTAKKVAENNATMAEYAAQDAQRKGEENAAEIQRRGAALKSAQRVALAKNGLDLGYGTAADLQDQTDFFTQQDAATARYNASLDAWRLRAGGQATAAEGRAAASNANLQATGTLIGGAGKVSNAWYAKKGT